MRRYVYLMQTLLPVGMAPPAMAEEAPAQAPAVDLMTLNQDERFLGQLWAFFRCG